MPRSPWLGFACALALAACQQPARPSARNEIVCADAQAEPSARVTACDALLESGDLTEAEKVQVQAYRGVAHRAAGDVTPALRDFEAVLRVDRNNADALEGRAAILVASGQLDAADPLVDRLIATNARLDSANFMKGEIAIARGDFAGAVTSYDRALQLNADLPLALAHRGRAKQHQNDELGALADYNGAIAMAPTLPDPRSGRCWINLLRDQNLDIARTDAETAVAADPRNVEAQICRGVLQLRGQEWALARSSFDAALVVEPGNPTALFGRGIARHRGGDDEGIRDMNQARDFDHHIGEQFDHLGVTTY